MKISLVHNGKELPFHSGNDANYIEAPDSGSYIIRVQNKSSRRRLAVISVDGVNILNGEDAKTDGPGYVLRPWQTVDIKGWHRTGEEAAAFTFEALKESYAAKTGRPNNVGIIGVAVFDEKVKHWSKYRKSSPIIRPQWTGGISYGSNATGGGVSSSSGSAKGAQIGTQVSSSVRGLQSSTGEGEFSYVDETSKSLGTGYGERLEMKTREAAFSKATEYPAQTISIKYATRNTLIKWGVVSETGEPELDPFPADKVGVEPPPGWNG